MIIPLSEDRWFPCLGHSFETKRPVDVCLGEKSSLVPMTKSQLFGFPKIKLDCRCCRVGIK